MRGVRTAEIVIAVGLVVVGVFSQPPDRFWVQNPTSKARLAVRVDSTSGLRWDALACPCVGSRRCRR